MLPGIVNLKMRGVIRLTRWREYIPFVIPLTVLGAILALVSPASASSTAGAVRPALRVPDVTPLSVRGLRFKPHERVTVVVQAGKRRVKTVLTGATGVFSVRFRDIWLTGCYSYVVRATGNRGSRAVIKHITACSAL